MNQQILNNSAQENRQLIYVYSQDFSENVETTETQDLAFFKGESGETYALNSNEVSKFYTGVGKASSALDFFKAGKKLSETQGKHFQSVSTNLKSDVELDSEKIEFFAIGLLSGCYKINSREESPILNADFSIYVDGLDSDKIEELSQKITAVAQGEFHCKDWLNKAANQKSPEEYTSFLKGLAEENNFEIEILNREQSKAAGLHAYLSVNQGSKYEAAFTIMQYNHPEAEKTFGLVGKNVIFDTGGISIKPSQNLHYMKSDMGGATAVLGSFYALTKVKPKINIVAILPVTDNAVDQDAYLPGDVIGSHSGKTIEVIDTDAEGRLTLADGLSYMVNNYNPDFLLDIATLTGSAVRALGYEAAAMHSENQEFADKIKSLGHKIGQRSWQFPLWDEYLENLKSDVADLKNFSGQPVADVINSAKFLQQFTHEHACWAHMDIAGVAFGSNAYSKDKSATGFGVWLLTELVLEMAKS